LERLEKLVDILWSDIRSPPFIVRECSNKVALTPEGERLCCVPMATQLSDFNRACKNLSAAKSELYLQVYFVTRPTTCWHLLSLQERHPSSVDKNCMIIMRCMLAAAFSPLTHSIHRVLNRLLTCGFHKRYKNEVEEIAQEESIKPVFLLHRAARWKLAIREAASRTAWELGEREREAKQEEEKCNMVFTT
jgi:hypothetical protein